MKTTITVPGNVKYLSEFIENLPSKCIINKSVTGCGGTTVELLSKRNSIILCPTKNLVESKSGKDILSITGDTSNLEIERYIRSKIKYKKIVVTYDALKRIINVIPNFSEYFLLIDEYHLLFNDYSFRSDPILFILHNFKRFTNWAFMTATPLNDEFILDELKDVDQVIYEWENIIPVNIIVKDTGYIQRELLKLIDIYQDRNLHIFLNSVSTIRNITKNITSDYRVVCSSNNKTKVNNMAKITDQVKKLNFYTSCAFCGCDVMDEDGFTIIICDTNISTTILDISTKIRQICGRIRNSKYKDQCTILLNTNRHRYAGITRTMFNRLVRESERQGRNYESLFNKGTDEEKLAALKMYNSEQATFYVNKYADRIFYDVNLKKQDIYNYNLVSEIYNNSISVVNTLNKSKFVSASKQIVRKNIGLSWIYDKLKDLDKDQFTFTELSKIFTQDFKEHGLKWTDKVVKNYFPQHDKKKKKINGKQETYYTFYL